MPGLKIGNGRRVRTEDLKSHSSTPLWHWHTIVSLAHSKRGSATRVILLWSPGVCKSMHEQDLQIERLALLGFACFTLGFEIALVLAVLQLGRPLYL